MKKQFLVALYKYKRMRIYARTLIECYSIGFMDYEIEPNTTEGKTARG